MLLSKFRIPLLKQFCKKDVVIVHQKLFLQMRYNHHMTIVRLPVAHQTCNRRFVRFKHTDLKTIKPFILPDIGEGINEVVVKGWLVKAGDHVKEFDGICEVESDKATVTITSRFEGQISKIHYEVGDMAKVGLPLVDIQMSSSASGSALDEQIDDSDSKQELIKSNNSQTLKRSHNVENKSSNQPEPQVATLPSVRRLATERGVDLSLIRPTGKQGQILKEDVLLFLESGGKQQVSVRDSTFVGTTTTTTPIQLETKVQLRGIKRAMFRTMTQSAKIPHFNYSDEIDMTRLVELTRSQRESNISKSIVEDKLSNFAIIIKLVSMALREYPQLNASVDESGDYLTEKHYHNIGVAVDTKSGLIVPNIKNVQNLNANQINSELVRLRKLAYETKLGPADLSGGTITLSNIGAIGGVFGVPVLVSPEIVIGALGRTRQLPRFNSKGGIDERHIMQLVWSADHRVVDGATLSRFSNLLKHYLEEPGMALLNMV